MKENIAKKYVKAIDAVSNKLLVNVYKSLNKVIGAYKIEKFNDILLASSIHKDIKVNLLLDFINTKDKMIINFIKLLAEKNRLMLIPTIYSELNSLIASRSGNFKGIINSNSDIKSKTIRDIESGLSRITSSNIKLSHIKSEKSEVRVEVEDLSLEISFSNEQFKAQVKEHILKAI